MSYNIVTGIQNSHILQKPSITFLDANPKRYSLTPLNPQQGEEGYIWIYGNDLTLQDEIRIIRVDDSHCGSQAATLVTNLEMGNIELLNSTVVRIKFIAPHLLTTSMKGHVCYRRSNSLLWSSVYMDSSKTKSDFIIDILQPTDFQVNPLYPYIGLSFTISFNGIGLSLKDNIFLSMDRTCDENKEKFPCKLFSQNPFQCQVIVDPPSNYGRILYVCYRKEGRMNYAAINGNITLLNRNPTFKLNPYPLYAGQKGKITFIGKELSLTDTIRFSLAGSICSEEKFVNTFFIANGEEVTLGNLYTYDVVGKGEECLQVCYKKTNSNDWTIARPQSTLSTVEKCVQGNFFVHMYTTHYTLPYSLITAKETMTLKLSSSLNIISKVKVVRAEEKCVLSFCLQGTSQITACALEQHKDDFASIDNKDVQVLLGASDTSYILCGSNTNNGEAFIPILSTESQVGSNKFSLKSTEAKVTLTSQLPTEWRVGFANLSTIFTGTDLNSSTDKVYAILTSELLSTSALTCPQPTNIILKEALVSSFKYSTITTSTIVMYTNSHLRSTGDTVHFCYLWSKGTRITYTGSITFLEQLPLEMKLTLPTSHKIRAGEWTQLSFIINSNSILSIKDNIYFYRSTSTIMKNCYCNEACLQSTRILYLDIQLIINTTTREETTAKFSRMEWIRPQGFDNYNFDSTYVVCYNISNSKSVTYMGRIDVGMAQPTYYQTKTMFNAYRVGDPILFTVVQSCRGLNCILLNINNKLQLIPINLQCYELSNSMNIYTEYIDKARIEDKNYIQRIVINKPGQYRVCYSIDGEYQELTSSLISSPSPLTVMEANPKSFISSPLKISAGELITINITCPLNECRSCEKLWIVPGIMSTCWEPIKNTFISDNCKSTVTTVQFSNQYLTEGHYTICYGSNINKNRRIPGILNILPSNPSIFTTTSTEIYTNQYSNITFTIYGKGLTTNDKIFLLTKKGYSCHDLWKNKLQSNGTLRTWFTPSIIPNFLHINNEGTKAIWIASNRYKRFSNDILFDKFLCDKPGESCTMQLCYMRYDATWAPVLLSVKPYRDIRLLLSNPFKASFEKSTIMVGMYSTVKVYGKGLHVNDILTMRLGHCEGKNITVLVGTPTVNLDGTEWTGVVRFIQGNFLDYVVCYTHGTSVTEIQEVDAAGQSVIVVLEELNYMYDIINISNNHEMTQYEELIVAATFNKTPKEELKSVEIIDINTECNYMPYYNSVGRQPEFNVLVQLESFKPSYFRGRLHLKQGTYALCMNLDMGLFRVTSRINKAKFIIDSVNPKSYSTFPNVIFPNQPFQLKFTFSTGTVGTNDLVQIIDGDLYDCGYRNTTIIFESPVAVEENSSYGIINNILLSEEFIDTKFSLCYSRTGGTFSTVPYNLLIDRNFYMISQIPNIWTTTPTQPQVTRTLKIKFFGNDMFSDFLSIKDHISLIAVTDDINDMCTSKEATISSSNDITKEGVNIIWTISSNKLKEGKYIICYTSITNGAVVRVANPPFLTVSPLQSPEGIFKNTGGSVDIFNGERFYLMFKSTVPLNPVLSFATNAHMKDAVLFSKTSDCKSSALTSDEVNIIPSNFHYKPIDMKPNSGMVISYLHIVMNTNPGEFFVCMRRVGRTKGEAFFDFEAIGDLNNFDIIKVSEMPIKSYITKPEHPRAWIPFIEVKPRFNNPYRLEDFSQLFFVPYSSSSSSSGGGIHGNDDDGDGDKTNKKNIGFINDCYRPTEGEAETKDTVLLNTKLQIITATEQMKYPFPSAGLFYLCFQLAKGTSFAASAHLPPLRIGNPSPTMYFVPEVIAINSIFTMGFTASDEIFKSSVSGNKVQLVFATKDVISGDMVPKCNEGKPYLDIVMSFDTLSITNNTFATVQPKNLKKGLFYVCFFVFDQPSFFPVPNAQGGFVFSVGLTGAQSYVIKPSSVYMGQILEITIFGNQLRNEDHAKVVDISSVTETTRNYDHICTSSALNADAEIGGTTGSLVNATLSTQAYYTPRMNSTGRFILCYQSVRLENIWKWVPELNNFTVDSPHPVAHIQQPIYSYEMEVSRLHIQDSSTTGLLSSKDKVKLVERGSGKAGFDCSEMSLNSKQIGAIQRVDKESTNTLAVYQVCAMGVTQLTVCYHLNGGAWAEVPLRIESSAYIFTPIQFLTTPFSGPKVTPLSPRPYEPFLLEFDSNDAKVMVNYLSFAHEPQIPCALNPLYIEPVYYKKEEEKLNTFTVALPKAGKYQLYLGAHKEKTDPRIAHKQIVTVASCDPCSFTPMYAFIGNNVTVAFKGKTIDSLSETDTVRIVPVVQGSKGLPCDNPTGPYASLILEPNISGSGRSRTLFTFFTGDKDTYVGDYYLCYRKATINSSYAIVTDEDAKLLTLSIYPALQTKVEICPSNPSFLETVTLNISFPITKYPKLTFSKKDELLLVASNIDCDAAKLTLASDVIHPVMNTIVQNDKVMWLSTLPNGHIETEYKLCFRFAEDSFFHDLNPVKLKIARQDPSYIVMQPPNIEPGNNAFKMFIYGHNLINNENIYFVDGSQRCDERCGETLNPTELPSITYDKEFKNNTLVELNFPQGINDKFTMAVCYRRTNHLLVRLAVYFFGDPNPESYNTSFVPRLGTRPLLTFLGTTLGAKDRVMIVDLGLNCDERRAAAIGKFVNVSNNGKWSSFYLPLIGANIKSGFYTVCYLIEGTVGYAAMKTPLEVKPGGPSSFKTSNTPMMGRSTEIIFDDLKYQSKKGDEAFLACAECSCFDGITADLPYGTPRVNALVDNETMTLRVGINNKSNYAVCYRLFDSGYAHVGKQLIRPMKNSPGAVKVSPTPILQGQRLTFIVTEFTAEGIDTTKNIIVPAPDKNDMAMLVTQERSCWENPEKRSEGILAKPLEVVEVTKTESTWRSHVPSLGPDTPPVRNFPAVFTLCYKEKGQNEYVAVPFPFKGFKMDSVNPSSYRTLPSVVTGGMIHINMTFPSSFIGDTAFIVDVANNKLTINNACDDKTSKIVAVEGSAFPIYTFSLPPQLVKSFVVVCYKRAGSTVAEVPQLLTLASPNPNMYTTNIFQQTGARQREYIVLTFTGTGLNYSADRVVFTNVSCATSLTWPPLSAPFVRRVSELTATPKQTEGTSLTTVVQFVDSVPLTVYVCYYHKGIWSEVGSSLQLATPAPTTLKLSPPVGLARVGQNIRIQLDGNDGKGVILAAVISADDTVEESWCHNFTSGQIQEPLLRVVDTSTLDIPIWKTAGPARVCVLNNEKMWTDVALTVNGSVSEVIVLDPNPSSMSVFPIVPRAGQQVTLTFNLLIPPDKGDKIRVTLPNATAACKGLASIDGFPASMSVNPDSKKNRSSITLRDEKDPLKYRSFKDSGLFQVCYYSAIEDIWSLVGGSVSNAGIRVSPMVPSDWKIEGKQPLVFAEKFVLKFEDAGGNLNAFGDSVWAVTQDQSCGSSHDKCSRCIVFNIDTKKSSATSVITQPTISLIVGKLNLCYKLRDATAAMFSRPLEVNSGELECHVEDAVRVGQEQEITFKKRSGLDVLTDKWLVSTFDTKTMDCDEGYDTHFADGRARIAKHNDTNVEYSVEWPVSMVKSKYRICYTHNGIPRPVCSCKQIETQSGECYVSTLRASPVSFTTIPSPTYVGQWIQLAFTLDKSMTEYPVTKVKLVKKVNELTVCKDQEAFSIPPDKDLIDVSSPTSYVYKFKYNYSNGPQDLIVCALSPKLSQNYARVGSIEPETSPNTLNIRPYLSLSTIPASSDLLRAMQTIVITFKHKSTREDDVVGLSDRIMFVKSPEECNESSTDVPGVRSALDIFMLDDTSFSTIPAPVLDTNNETRTSRVFVTFDAEKGVGKHFVCYKLNGGTWAPVTGHIQVGSAAVKGCVQQLPTSNPNKGTLKGMRAMQYVQMTIVGTLDTINQRSSKDAVRVVPQSTPCLIDKDGVFNSKVSIDDENVSTIAFTPRVGTFKVCYRLGGESDLTANWSPVCTKLLFTEPSPTATFTGCLRVGQTLNVKALHRNNLLFSREDRFRFVSGTDHCIYADNTQTVSNTIRVGDKPQVIDGTAVDSTTDLFNIPPAFIGQGTTNLRLCYKDAAKNQFAVPLDNDRTDASEYAVADRFIDSIGKQSDITVGQRVLMTFGTKSNPKEGQLRPFAELPAGPFKPIVPYDSNFDGASSFHLKSTERYIEGRCYVDDPSLNNVYGNSTQTLGSFDPTTTGMYVACYKSTGCSVEDVGMPFRVGDYNPGKWNFDMTEPRYGQLLHITFSKNKQESDALPLKPGIDRAEVLLGTSSCWDLSATDGKLVKGTSGDSTTSDFFFAAPPPHDSKPSKMRVCYRLGDKSWSNLRDNEVTLNPANPSSFSVVNFPARTMQLNYIKVSGSSLSANDRVKIIDKSGLCSDSSKLPTGIVMSTPESIEQVSDSVNEWRVLNATATQTVFTMSSTVTGDFRVCYRLGGDKVWTLVYGNLSIQSRDPVEVEQTPRSPAEGEIFTLNFKSAKEFSSLSKDDRIALYSGIVPCRAPRSDADAIITSPSRTDKLPNNLFFQIAAATRGNYTLCYLKGDGFTIVWGFEIVEIGPNPWNYSILPHPTLMRTNQLVSYVFRGFGLIANKNQKKTDEVKLIESLNPPTDETCQTQASAAQLEYYPLQANGTHAVQVVLSPPTAKGSYWICYKLNGGRFYSMKSIAIILAKEDPYGAERKKTGGIIWDGEAETWTIKTDEPPVEGAFLFYSLVQCNNFPYYVVPKSSTSEFPQGVAIIRNGTALLRSGPPTAPGETLSLCYYAKGVVTRLAKSVLQVVQGTPPALNKPVTAKALQLFRFNLTVIPTHLDYVVLLTDADRCVGKAAPSPSDDAFVSVENGPTHIVVTTAVKKEGTFYICYSHRAGRCGTGETQECARTVGRVEASAPSPSGWLMTPSMVHTTDLVTIQLSYPSKANKAQTPAKLWLTPLTEKLAVSTGEVASACIKSMKNKNRINLLLASHSSNVWTVRLNETGAYALCYISDGDLLPTIFSSSPNLGPVVYLTKVTSVIFSVAPTVGTENIIILHGGGLSQDDQLVAVGISDASNIPNDVCNNPSYTPHATAAKSTAGYGLNAMASQMRFDKAGNYVLCFQAAASRGPMVLITPNAFEVNFMFLRYRVVSVALKDTPLELVFWGNGLTLSDLVALIPVKRFVKMQNEICADGRYNAVTSASEDGTTSFFGTVPTMTGDYAVCYMKRGLKSILLPDQIKVAERTATGAIFTVVPKCTESNICSPQPVVALIDDSGETTSDPFATVVMRLRLVNGTAVDHLFSGGTVYSQKNYSEFYFFVATIFKSGTYIMEAEFSLRGGVKLFAKSPHLFVSKARGQQGIATVTCHPVGIIERSEIKSQAPNITCVIETKTPLAPTAYNVHLNAGTSTEVVRDDTKGYPQYHFTVFPPHDQPKIQFVSIFIEAAPPLESWQVTNSPVIVRIGSEPEEGSTLSCASDSVDLPSPTMTRVNSRLVCHAQGKRKIGNNEWNIVAMPKYMRIFSEYDKSDLTRTTVDIGDYPDNLDGNYIFYVDVSRALRSFSVFGSVPFRKGSNTYVPMRGSPITVVVIGNPKPDDSSIFCVSEKSASKLWFTPAESFNCTLSLRADGHFVNGVPQDFSLKVTDGGSIQFVSMQAWGTILTIYGAAPPSSRLVTDQTVSDQVFDVSVTFIPQSRLIASVSGKLVYTTSVKVSKEEDDRLLILLTGSGLVLSHKYGVRSSIDCALGVENEATATSIRGFPNHLQLNLTTPKGPFYLCFAPSDQHKRWQLLTNEKLNSPSGDRGGVGGGIDMWTVLLILGVILLAVLLVLLIVLVWKLCIYTRRGEVTKSGSAVYMPPRANYRFVRSSTAMPDAQKQQQQQRAVSKKVTKQDVNRVRINISDYSVTSTNVLAARDGEANANHKGFNGYKNCERDSNERHGLYDNLDSINSEEDFRRFVPPAPPPQPPVMDEPPASSNAVQHVDESYEGLPSSGPYQHLHHESHIFSPANGEADEEQTWAGPFIVRGHTSRPLVDLDHFLHSPENKNNAPENGR